MASQDDPLDCSPDVTKWNPGVLKAAEKSRITLRFIQATGMRSTSARDVRVKDIGTGGIFGLRFLCVQKR